MKPVIRIIDDDEVMRRSWIFLLEAEDMDVRAYADAEEFLDHDDFEQCGCLLLDVRMPKMSGLELQEYLNNKSVTLPIVFISGHGDIDMAVHALKKGALDFLQKPVDDERLIQALQSAVAKDIARRECEEKIEDQFERYKLLTSREKEVVHWVSQGLMNKVIADKLEISERTVQIHRGVAMRKLAVKSSIDLLKFLQVIGKE